MFRLNLIALIVAPWFMVASGCANLRLPAIDPSGQRFFLPSPNYTTVAEDSPVRRIFPRGERPLPGPYEPALFNRHRDHLARLFQHDGPLLRGTSDSPPAFESPAPPPLCGPDGSAPDGSPCYPIGSPTESSFSRTLANDVDPVSSARLKLGPEVVLQRQHIVARVGDEVILVGSVKSPSGIARVGEPVQWSLSNDSVGTIIDTARRQPRHQLFGFLRPASQSALNAGCGNCAKSVTASRCNRLPRNPVDSTDDVYLSRGETWVSLTSGSPGVSYVTLSAPNLHARRHATAVIQWRNDYTDATISPPSFDTPAAELDSTDAFTPQTPFEVNPPPSNDDSASPSPDQESTTPPPRTEFAGITIASPDGLRGPPGATVGESVPYDINVRNKSTTEDARNVVVYTELDASVTFDDSTIAPQMDQTRRRIVWELGRIPPSQTRRLRANFTFSREGVTPLVFVAEDRERSGTRVSNSIETEARRQAIVLEVSEALHETDGTPITPQEGTRFKHEIRVTNQSERTATVQLLVHHWTPGIVPEVAQGQNQTNPERGAEGPSIEVLRGQTRTVDLPMIAEQAGQHSFQVRATGPGRPVEETATVQVSSAPLRMSVTPSTERLRPGEPVRFQCSIRNYSSRPIPNARLEVIADPGLEIRGVPEQFARSALGWSATVNIPGEHEVPFQVNCRLDRNINASDVTFWLRVTGEGLEEPHQEQATIAVDRTAFRPPPPSPAVDSQLQSGTVGRLQATLEAFPQAVRVGESIEYELVVRNDTDHSYRDVLVSMEASENLEWNGVKSPPATRSTLADNGRVLNFSSIREILPHESLTYRVRATPSRRGTAKLFSRITAGNLRSPISVFSETTVN